MTEIRRQLSLLSLYDYHVRYALSNTTEYEIAYYFYGLCCERKIDISISYDKKINCITFNDSYYNILYYTPRPVEVITTPRYAIFSRHFWVLFRTVRLYILSLIM